LITEYQFDSLVIGGSLESLIYSYLCNKKIIMLQPIYPLETITIPYCDTLRFMGYAKNQAVELSELWDRLSFVSSMLGLMAVPNIISTNRSTENEYTLITKNNKRVKITADEIINFDSIWNERLFMIDWFNVRSGNNHGHNKIHDHEESFIKEINFYKSKRFGVNGKVKDIMAVSDLLVDEVKDVNYSEGIARLKVLSMMSEAGIRGQSNGFDKSGRRLHYALSIEHTFREYRKKYCPMMSLQQVLKLEPEREGQWNITKKLFRHNQISILRESFQLPGNL
tara:strand:- start:2232 stop:3074 length:843 start_codon:yes stop_codon:yes gene_type:complete